MKILFYRYGSICEPDLIECFKAAGIEVVEEKLELEKKKCTPGEVVERISKRFSSDTYLFVFSLNFFPAVSEICQVYKIPYVCWTVDSPVMELFSPSLKNSVNRVFFFDKAQYEYFGKELQNCFYMPLATNVKRWQLVVSQASQADKNRFATDISLVGSLYSEKNPYRKIEGLSDWARGYVDGIVQSQMKIFGYNIIETALNDRLMQEFEEKVPDLKAGPYAENLSKKYVMANNFIGMEIAYRERVQYLNGLASIGKLDLYTFSDTSELDNSIKVHQGAKTLTEMPLIFNQSKINLNITIRPIQTGLSLRIFDVLGCGGFLMTNYQSELPDFFNIGEDIEAFASEEELVDKCAYYLQNDDAREKIARSGFEKVSKYHTYEQRFSEMIKAIYAML